ncbi:hypothetical protein [Iningainema tapete]|uniref:Uncharacterized protein n=1 Tax=Iningainema tapete BLCC-T55 TaxID=2748662 RepID=A0A8J6XLZ9_9CYAN|nr:hypothetical protein [Iningainema tapete]MBD2773376.1 hypothetical protein [Iningainema tapete BLCC-T55]
MNREELFAIVHSCSGWNGYTFDPRSYILAVNTIYPEGKSWVISALRDYCHLLIDNGDWIIEATKVFFLLRILFVPKEHNIYFPRIKLGISASSQMLTNHDFPIYPLVLLEDVPLLIVGEFILGGLPENPLAQIDFCEHYCQLRTTPLHPPDNPLLLYELLQRWESETEIAVLQAQLLRLVQTVYTLPGINEPGFFCYLKVPEIWQQCINTFQNLDAVWNEQQNDYCL